MMQYELRISTNFIDRLYMHAERCFPHEAVALLFGVISGKSILANRIELMENISEMKHTTFSVDPEEEYRLLIEAEEQGESLIGIFHSHPAPPKPSLSDLKNMRLNPVVWLIATKQSGKWVSKAYVLEKESAKEIIITDADP